MTLVDFIRLIVHNIKLLVLIPVVMAAAVYYLVKDMPDKYQATTLIYTGIASGYNLESNGGGRVDYFSANNAFDNMINTIKAKETQKEVALSLLTQHLVLTKHDPTILGRKAYQKLQQLVPAQAKKEFLVKGNPKATYEKMLAATHTSGSWINGLLNSSHPYYSYRAMGKVSAKRKGSSDMITIGYHSDDEGVSRHTLSFLLEKFAARHKFLKKSETGDVVAYFQRQLAKAKAKLNGVEDRLKDFRERGRILNYYEQTKFIASKKEDITDAHKKEVGNLEASKAVLKELERKLDLNQAFFLKNDEILTKKTRLSNLVVAMTLQRTDTSKAKIYKSANQAALKTEVNKLKKSLKKDVLDLYNYRHSTEGIAIEDLLAKWLNNLVAVEQSRARAKVLGERLSDIDREYDRFAPLGSGLKKLEREVGVEERAYIEILHGLNQALLRQQNIELSSNLEIVDMPSVIRQANKKMMLVILAFLVGAFGTLGFVIATELLDSTLKSPQRATRVTELPLAGALPIHRIKMKEHHQKVEKALVNQICNQITQWTSGVSQPIVTITSTQIQEGKSFLSGAIAKNFRLSGKKVLQVNPANSSNAHRYKSDREYAVTPEIAHQASITPWVNEGENYDLILVELPALVQGQIPVKILDQAALNLLIVRSNRAWKNADKHLTSSHLSNKGAESNQYRNALVLNGVRPHYLEELVGEYGQSPSIRSWVKRIFRFEFKVKKFKVKRT
ncbi:hypothetical protein BKI52_34585 [marine bacterium AO1-C]|nr:hypothetical protein BKI52_34585 [marine bacterium AO1-C]